ncbi:MAG: hypothetical protein AAB510_03315 [Patescibacteria group bacterium]
MTEDLNTKKDQTEEEQEAKDLAELKEQLQKLDKSKEERIRKNAAEIAILERELKVDEQPVVNNESEPTPVPTEPKKVNAVRRFIPPVEDENDFKDPWELTPEEEEARKKEDQEIKEHLYRLAHGTSTENTRVKVRQEGVLGSREEAALTAARDAYVTAYQKFIKDRRKGVLGKVRYAYESLVGKTIKESETPEDLKKLESEYTSATIILGKAMYETKQEELGLDQSTTNPALNNYKQNEIFQRIIIEEQKTLILAKAESLPAKERGLVGKALDAYLKLSPTKRLAASVGLSLIFAIITGGVSTTLQGATFLGIKAARVAGSVTIGKGWGMLVDKTLGKLTTKLRENTTEELRTTFDIQNLDQTKIQYEKILGREKKDKRALLVMKAAGGLALGLTTSIAIGRELGDIPVSSEKHINTTAEKPTTSTAPNTTPPVTSASSEATPIVKVSPTPEIPKASSGETDLGGRMKMPDGVAPEKVAVIDDAVVHQGEGIENAFIRQIENNTDLAEKLGFKGDITDKKALHIFAQHKAHGIAIEKGYVDPETGREVRIMEADKVGYQITADTKGNFTVTEVDIKGDVLATYANPNGADFGQNPDNPYDTVHKKEIPVAKLHTPTVEMPAEDQNIERPQIEPTEAESPVIDTTETKPILTQEERINKILTEHPHRGLGGATPDQIRSEVLETDKLLTETDIRNKLFGQYNIIKPENLDIKTEAPEATTGGNINNTSSAPDTRSNIAKILEENPALKNTDFIKNEFNLTTEELAETAKVYKENILHMTQAHNSTYAAEWFSMKTFKVRDLLQNVKDGNYVPESPLMNYLKKIYETTGLEPKSNTSGSILFKKPETAEQYVIRALQYAEKNGDLNKLKLQ